MYNGQLRLIREKVATAMRTSGAHVLTITQQSMTDVRMATTDNYQGEESDLVSETSSLPHTHI
jgi:hypothetical protein